ncbi:hypothetical protein GCM10010363_12450 [Streptomyces omiyaensis]|nr:hypothetical protein GCM10010363_12450 [Streptomyces omiyaensis]
MQLPQRRKVLLRPGSHSRAEADPLCLIIDIQPPASMQTPERSRSKAVQHFFPASGNELVYYIQHLARRRRLSRPRDCLDVDPAAAQRRGQDSAGLVWELRWDHLHPQLAQHGRRRIIGWAGQ